MSQRKARPKLVAPPPPISHARQPTRFTASVTLFTADPGARQQTPDRQQTRTWTPRPVWKSTSTHTQTYTPITQHRPTIKHRQTAEAQTETYTNTHANHIYTDAYPQVTSANTHTQIHKMHI